MSLSPEMPLVAVGNAIRYLRLFPSPAKTSLMSIKASWKTPLHQFQQRHNYSSFWNVFWCESPCRRGISQLEECPRGCSLGWGPAVRCSHPSSQRMPGTVAECTPRWLLTLGLDTIPFPKDVKPQHVFSAHRYWILRKHIYAMANQSKALTSISLLNNLGFSLKMQAASF